MLNGFENGDALGQSLRTVRNDRRAKPAPCVACFPLVLRRMRAVFSGLCCIYGHVVQFRARRPVWCTALCVQHACFPWAVVVCISINAGLDVVCNCCSHCSMRNHWGHAVDQLRRYVYCDGNQLGSDRTLSGRRGLGVVAETSRLKQTAYFEPLPGSGDDLAGR